MIRFPRDRKRPQPRQVLARARECAGRRAVVLARALVEVHRPRAQSQIERAPIDQPLGHRVDHTARRVVRDAILSFKRALHDIPLFSVGTRWGRRKHHRRRSRGVSTRASRMNRQLAPRLGEAVVDFGEQKAVGASDFAIATERTANEAVRLRLGLFAVAHRDAQLARMAGVALRKLAHNLGALGVLDEFAIGVLVRLGVAEALEEAHGGRRGARRGRRRRLWWRRWRRRRLWWARGHDGAQLLVLGRDFIVLHRVALAYQKVVARALCAFGLTAVVEIVIVLTAKMLADTRMPAHTVTQRRDRAHAVDELELADFVQETATDSSMNTPFAGHSRAHRLGKGEELVAFVDCPCVGFDRRRGRRRS